MRSGTATPTQAAEVRVKQETGKALAALLAYKRRVELEGGDEDSREQMDALTGAAMVEEPAAVYELLKRGELRIGGRSDSSRRDRRRREDESEDEDELRQRKEAAMAAMKAPLKRRLNERGESEEKGRKEPEADEEMRERRKGKEERRDADPPKYTDSDFQAEVALRFHELENASARDRIWKTAYATAMANTESDDALVINHSSPTTPHEQRAPIVSATPEDHRRKASGSRVLLRVSVQ